MWAVSRRLPSLGRGGIGAHTSMTRRLLQTGGAVSHNKFILPQRGPNCTGTPLSLYANLLQKNILKEDVAQAALTELSSIFDLIRSGNSEKKGLYIHGPPGSGKSMSMDLFHHCLASDAQLSGVKTKRLHFHEFLHDTHKRMHKKRIGNAEKDSEHIVVRVADEISSEVDILCFDEMNVTTVQDCAILSPLFQRLFTNGVVCIMTSNRKPEDLYTDGLNRHVFLPPLLSKLHGYCKVISVDTDSDYRLLQMQEDAACGAETDRVFHWPSTDGGDAFIDHWMVKLADELKPEKRTFNIAYGRTMEVNVLSSNIGVFDFNDLCGREKGSKHYSVDDYFALTKHLHTFIVRNVPELQVDHHNEARRWTNFIDACYENQCRLILTLGCHPQDILKRLLPLTEMTMHKVGAGYVGASDYDSSNSSSGVLAAVDRMKAAIQRGSESSSDPQSSCMIDRPAGIAALDVSRFDPAKDQEIWRQAKVAGSCSNPLPQVSRSWDRRRRSSGFSWESSDPTAEQETVKGVFRAAVASLQESGFAAHRMASRLNEMQTNAYFAACEAKRHF
eukprot:GEMP01022817.1.p1 GENE.GEMP01022817.1~~GEMP01022817.1.p1  ORF type:complete len:559 (+),score=127.28 GEMP01022817.1:90-1766(+)